MTEYPMDTHSKSQFTRDFNLTKVLFLILHLTELTFQDSSDYEIVKEGFNIVMASFIFTSLMSIGSSDTRSKLNSLPNTLVFFSCLSHLAPSVSRVAICVSQVLLDGLQKKQRLLVVRASSYEPG